MKVELASTAQSLGTLHQSKHKNKLHRLTQERTKYFYTAEYSYFAND